MIRSKTDRAIAIDQFGVLYWIGHFFQESFYNCRCFPTQEATLKTKAPTKLQMQWERTLLCGIWTSPVCPSGAKVDSVCSPQVAVLGVISYSLQPGETRSLLGCTKTLIYMMCSTHTIWMVRWMVCVRVCINPHNLARNSIFHIPGHIPGRLWAFSLSWWRLANQLVQRVSQKHPDIWGIQKWCTMDTLWKRGTKKDLTADPTR